MGLTEHFHCHPQLWVERTDRIWFPLSVKEPTIQLEGFKSAAFSVQQECLSQNTSLWVWQIGPLMTHCVFPPHFPVATSYMFKLRLKGNLRELSCLFMCSFLVIKQEKQRSLFEGSWAGTLSPR